MQPANVPLPLQVMTDLQRYLLKLPPREGEFRDQILGRIWA